MAHLDVTVVAKVERRELHALLETDRTGGIEGLQPPTIIDAVAPRSAVIARDPVVVDVALETVRVAVRLRRRKHRASGDIGFLGFLLSRLVVALGRRGLRGCLRLLIGGGLLVRRLRVIGSHRIGVKRLGCRLGVGRIELGFTRRYDSVGVSVVIRMCV